MPTAYDPFGLAARDKDRDPANGPAVPNMGGIPTTPLSPSANLNPFAIPPVAAPAGGRPTEGAATPPTAAAPQTPPTAPAPSAAPPTEGAEGSGAVAAGSGVTINIGEQAKKQEGPQSTSGQPGQPSAGQPTASASGAATPQGGAAPGLPPAVKLDRMPVATEMNFAPPGSVFETPNGSMTRGADGNWQFQPNEAGILKYKEAKVREIQKFGSFPMSNDPSAPLPPVEPGQKWFNPFTNSWSEG